MTNELARHLTTEVVAELLAANRDLTNFLKNEVFADGEGMGWMCGEVVLDIAATLGLEPACLEVWGGQAPLARDVAPQGCLRRRMTLVLGRHGLTGFGDDWGKKACDPTLPAVAQDGEVVILISVKTEIWLRVSSGWNPTAATPGRSRQRRGPRGAEA